MSEATTEKQNEAERRPGPWDSPANPKAFGFTLPILVSSTRRFGDAVIFMFFAASGILCELITHAITTNTAFIIAGPVIVLLLYLATASLNRGFRLRFDQLGDNCYYLGFLFTLTALSIALYDFRGLDFDISTIVSNFGVALASTILGVLLRVLLSQMREDPIEVEEQSRYELAQASAMLKNELYASVRDMNSFRELLQQSIAQSFEEVNEKSKESILRAAEELSEAARSINQEIVERNEQLGERFDRFNDLTQRSVSSLESLVESMERVRPPNELIHDAFEKTVTSIERLREESEKIYRMTEKQRQATQSSITAASYAIQSVSEDLSKLSGEGSPLGAVVNNLNATTKSLGTHRCT
jgi:methyl-accepting chemotaxis protein